MAIAINKQFYKSKTMYAAIGLALFGVLQALGINLPYETLYAVMAAFGLYGLRDAAGKIGLK